MGSGGWLNGVDGWDGWMDGQTGSATCQGWRVFILLFVVIRNSFIIRSTLTPWYNDWYNKRISDNHYYLYMR